MKKVLADYLEICNKFRNCGLSKLERKQRHNALVDWKNKDYGEESLTLCDIKDFWEENSQICWNKLFICKVICPIIAADLEIGGFDGLNLLFHCFRGHENSYIYADSPLAIFCEFSGYKYQPVQLANLLLEYDPNNVDALKYKYYVLKDFLEFSIHEMPAGVLNGMNGASISDIPVMLKDIEDFENLSSRSHRIVIPTCVLSALH